jgi:hypothetical protein
LVGSTSQGPVSATTFVVPWGLIGLAVLFLQIPVLMILRRNRRASLDLASATSAESSMVTAGSEPAGGATPATSAVMGLTVPPVVVIDDDSGRPAKEPMA